MTDLPKKKLDRLGKKKVCVGKLKSRKQPEQAARGTHYETGNRPCRHVDWSSTPIRQHSQLLLLLHATSLEHFNWTTIVYPLRQYAPILLAAGIILLFAGFAGSRRSNAEKPREEANTEDEKS